MTDLKRLNDFLSADLFDDGFDGPEQIAAVREWLARNGWLMTAEKMEDEAGDAAMLGYWEAKSALNALASELRK